MSVRGAPAFMLLTRGGPGDAPEDARAQGRRQVGAQGETHEVRACRRHVVVGDEGRALDHAGPRRADVLGERGAGDAAAPVPVLRQGRVMDPRSPAPSLEGRARRARADKDSGDQEPDPHERLRAGPASDVAAARSTGPGHRSGDAWTCSSSSRQVKRGGCEVKVEFVGTAIRG